MKLLVTGLAALAAAVPLAGVATAAPSAPDVPPGTIEVEEGNKPFLVGHAVGVQIYTCNGSTWGPATPRANVYGDNGKLLMTHFAGPSWQANDGSKTMAQRVDGVTVDETAIPWLLLKAVSPSAGADGDRLAHTTYIQRVATTGGLPPAAGACNAGTAGERVEIPYTADYVFWKATSSEGDEQ